MVCPGKRFNANRCSQLNVIIWSYYGNNVRVIIVGMFGDIIEGILGVIIGAMFVLLL